MFQKSLIGIFIVLCSFSANAHEVWLERDQTGTARVYLGEPGQPDSGDKIANLKDAQVFTDNRNDVATLTQNNDHWEANVTGEGDVRLFTDKVWLPWSVESVSWWEFWKDEKLKGAIFQARTGRSETSAKLTYELVPVTQNGHVFTAMFKGKPLTGQHIMLVTPSNKEVELITDEKGQISVPLTEKGQFLLSSEHTIETNAMHSGIKVASLMYITSLTFVNE
ncbi:MAG: hypothetical protein ABJK37_00490 [Paraglaciecola sp.]|uniref:hypothetical protein n=1 Tax=Paraglaciecola sp. TaxID=1920173 RepID=UPI0032994A3A